MCHINHTHKILLLLMYVFVYIIFNFLTPKMSRKIRLSPKQFQLSYNPLSSLLYTPSLPNFIIHLTQYYRVGAVELSVPTPPLKPTPLLLNMSRQYPRQTVECFKITIKRKVWNIEWFLGI
jgi:hypothetical protein